MVRPRKCRRIGHMPECRYFAPPGRDQNGIPEVIISFDEVEALRLSDIEKFEQGNAAEKMGISRGTFQRILGRAREKLADALVNGKAIKIEGGEYFSIAGEGSVSQYPPCYEEDLQQRDEMQHNGHCHGFRHGRCD